MPRRTANQRRRKVVGGDQRVSPSAKILGKTLTSAYSARYCVQTAASQSVAAHLDTKNGSTNPIYHWNHICTDRRLAGMGQQSCEFCVTFCCSILTTGIKKVSEMTFDYTDCWNLTDSVSPNNLTFTDMPFSYSLRSSDSSKTIPTPQFAYVLNNTAPEDKKHSCYIQFNVISDLDAPVFQYYKLTNFYQNNRRYVQSINTGQLKGDYVSPNSLSGSNCKPLAVDSEDRAIYPCGLIANSVFNGVFPWVHYLGF